MSRVLLTGGIVVVTAMAAAAVARRRMVSRDYCNFRVSYATLNAKERVLFWERVAQEDALPDGWTVTLDRDAAR